MPIFYPKIEENGHVVLVTRATEVPKGTEAWDIPVDKVGLQNFIQTLLDDMHEQITAAKQVTPALEARIENVVETVREQAKEVVELSYAQKSVSLDQTFLAAPLGQQMDLACQAWENMREYSGRINLPGAKLVSSASRDEGISSNEE